MILLGWLRESESKAWTSSVLEQKTSESFRQACRRFIYTKNLLPVVASNNGDTGSLSKSLQPPSAATPVIKKVIGQMETEDGWVPLGAVGTQLANLASDFDPRTYGFLKLIDLVRKTNAFDVEQRLGKPLRIRIRKPITKMQKKR